LIPVADSSGNQFQLKNCNNPLVDFGLLNIDRACVLVQVQRVL
jgi:hypothetical protein